MGALDESLLLSVEEFSALAPADQEAYLRLLEDADSAWTLTEKQLYADGLADEVKELLYGGAAGGGKSEWILNRAWRLSRQIPGHRTLILRTTFPELKRSIIARSIILYATHTPRDEMPRYKSAEKVWEFPNGSVIEFGFCASVEDAAQYLSAEYQMIAFDEVTQFTSEMYDLIRSRARTTLSMKKKGARPHIIAATNPGNRGHAYFKGTFVDNTEYGELGPVLLVRNDDDSWRRVLEGETQDPRKLRHVAFVPSTIIDNPHIDPDYVNNLMTQPMKIQQRMLYGNWDLPEGMFFDEWKRTIVDTEGKEIPYHVIPTFPVPDSWFKVRATDWGFAAPFATIWLAWDPDGRVYAYREVYQARLTPVEQANLVMKAQGMQEKIQRSVADPACWAKKDTLTTADQWDHAGFKNHKAKNDRLAGWLRVREYLKPMDDGFPALQVMDCCTNLIRTLPVMIHDKINAEDLDTTLEDHIIDALRYGLMTRARSMGAPRPGPVDRVTKHIQRMMKGSKKSGAKLAF